MNEVLNHGVTGLNHAGKVFYDYAAGVLLQSALLVLVLLVADLLLRKRVRAVFRYCVWLLVVAKLILPPTLALPTGIGYWLGDRLPATFPGSDRLTPAFQSGPAGLDASPGSSSSRETAQVESPTKASKVGAPITPTAAGLTPLTWTGLIFLLWLGGVLAFAALLVQRLRFVRGLTAFSLPADERFRHIMAECAKQVGIRREIELRVSGTMSSPALCGLLRPVVLVPARILETLSPEGLKAILIHELAHLKRGDVWVNTLQTVLQVLHFYNPFVWLANAVIRRTREEAVDETVLVALGGQAENYSNTLIDIGELALWKADLGLRLIGVAESERLLKWRIKHMLTRPVPQTARIGMLGMAALVITAALLLPMARAERSNKTAAVTTQTIGADASRKAPVAEDSNVFIDPNTGITFRKARVLSGPGDVIKSTKGVRISPNGKLLLSEVTVVPLDGSRPSTLADLPQGVFEGAWSPNGKKVAAEGGGTWVIPVDSETGRPTGPAEKVHGNGFGWAVWLPDSEGLRFLPASWAIPGFGYASLRESGLTDVADGSKPAKRSPDGKRVAFVEFGRGDTVLSVKPTIGGPAKKVANDGVPVLWSADSQWLIYSKAREGASGSVEEPRFFRVADGHERKLTLPDHWTLVGPAPDGKKLLCYCSSYDLGERLAVISVAGGPPCQLGEQMPKLMPHFDHVWSPDSGSIVVPNDVDGADAGLMALPLSGAAPVPLRMDVRVPGKIICRQLSPRMDYVLFCVSADGKTYDMWAAPVSWDQMRTTGPATLIFKDYGGSAMRGFWSPDGKKIALMRKASEIWIASPEGGEPRQLTGGPGLRGWPLWSPDGKRIAFYLSDSTGHSLQVIPASGGEAKTVTRFNLPGGGVGLINDGQFGQVAWSLDGTTLIVAKQTEILSISISDGQSRPLVKATDIGGKRIDHLRGSPDGKTLAFRANHQFFLYDSRDGHVTKIADGVPNGYFCWSPDGKWISYYGGSHFVKARPEGVLWEMDVEEAVAKLAK